MASVETRKENGLALVKIDNPPVNAAGYSVRIGLVNAVRDLAGDETVRVIVLYAAGRTFVAGADIREFGQPPKQPGLPEVCEILEASAKPIVCVLHGTTLGGGLEIALSCHARVGIKGLRLGLPEVNLGLLPGAGGTQRLPRLVDGQTALTMITSGKPVSANVALDAGLLDDLQEGDPEAVALAAGQKVLNGTLKTRVTADQDNRLSANEIDAFRAKITGEVAERALKAAEASNLPLAEGLKIERELFVEAMGSNAHKGLKHAFFAERAVAHIPEAKAEARELTSGGVIGGGTMGSGIATAMLLAGMPVTLVEMEKDRVDFACNTITKNLAGAVQRGKLTEAQRDTALVALTCTTDMAALADADVVIEAVFESMEVKQEVFGKLDEVCKHGAILATNTSYLDVNEIASRTKRPQNVIGLHFFSPAHVMRLLEVVIGKETAPETVATCFRLAKKLRKIGVRAEVCDGFIGNRILAHYLKSTSYMHLDGAPFDQIDTALEEFGFAMGPFAVSDLAGLDIGWATRKRKAAVRPAQERYVEIADRICEQGWFGRKTGKGFYLYDGKARSANPAVAEFAQAERDAKGITRRSFTNQEIVDRYMAAMVSEAARVVEDKIALRPIDVDAVFLFGYGFPRVWGGPLQYADMTGLDVLVQRIETYAREDPYYWQVPDLLRELAEAGKTFGDLNKGA
ncbi:MULTISPECIES: 3-hydroxyacyl-CoA dehydrogenase NAD-binding domain-containing protein [unclassified Ruegeria]|uniref:3-hydroxyacyl-CoA dehydrogenase NAD-binding domain-containing protein n=1 Tax=unclassified Ruegeria TaxID=2625375 RepID=UPI001ADB24DD|nr:MULTISPECIES: 3-hydroxyacyl-CoA dehydrogenase NAD-binding domain-containing protein [unclassified Ruegeria]MBO9413623.1 enoyl-CoA hydratase/isomerase family protein [Ruegeria sp. R8_1]MBO9417609.1 enoyl-CoA hydratase/isomerase family protein [Ruegeria sp. R8_2]